ncbi:MAG: arylesterase [Pseudomonadota bacterium]
MPAMADTLRIVALGDSLTAGYQLPPDYSFPARLQIALKAKGHDVEVVNAGVSGDTSSGGLARFGWAVPDGTDLVIVELGANDALRGIDPSQTRKSIDKILQNIAAVGADALLTGMIAPPNMGPDYAASFNPIYPELAKKHGVALYPFFLEGVAAKRDLNLADGIHPNEAGVDVIVANILPAVEKLISKRIAK